MPETSLQLHSPAFSRGEFVHFAYSEVGEDEPPELHWRNVPEGTASFVLLLESPDLGDGGPFTRWLLYDVPASRSGLPRGQQAGTVGRNDDQRVGYSGPAQPTSGDVRYVFRLYALDVESLALPPGARREQVEDAMAGHVLDEAELMGRFRR